MKSQSFTRFAAWIPLCAALALTVPALMTASAAPEPHSGDLGQATVLRTVLQNTGHQNTGHHSAAVATRHTLTHHLAASVASVGSPAYRNFFPTAIPNYPLAHTRLTSFATPNTSTGDPVTLEAYSTSEIIHLTNGDPNSASFGSVVRAPVSASDTSIGPNIPITFTVKVNNDSATTQASHVYIQIKNPNSAYQGNDGMEHKVFTYDPLNYETQPGNTSTFVPQGDSGSASLVLFNGGGGDPYHINNNVQLAEEGEVGGFEADNNALIGVGQSQDQGLQFFPTFGFFATNIPVTSFASSGQEYECQFLDPNPFGNGNGTPASPYGYTGTEDATTTDYGTPYYLAGFDDQTPQSFGPVGGAFGATQQGIGNHGVPTNYHIPADKDWMELTQEAPGSDYYQVTWCPPHTASDFYIDVIVVDNQANWRIYDNVWGFSTQPFVGNNDILFVADNVLGQKFAASALQSQGIANLRPLFYGAESYLTDQDLTYLPTAAFSYIAPPNGAALPAVPILQYGNAGPEATSGDSGVGYVGLPLNYLDTSLTATSPSATTGNTVLTNVTLNPAPTVETVQNGVINGDFIPSQNGPTPVPASFTITFTETSVTPQVTATMNAPGGQFVSPALPSGVYTITVNYPGTIIIPGTTTPVINSLGFGSYSDTVTNDTGFGQYHLNQQSNYLPDGNTQTTIPRFQQPFEVPKSQAYDIWRILCRGPLNPALLTETPAQGGYAPDGVVSQPAVHDPLTGFQAPASTNVFRATRCVIWASPFTGDQPLTVGGSISDPATQAMLRQFVANGGRLFVTGQEVAASLTEGGLFQNGPGGFVHDVLNAQFDSSGAGSDNQTLAGSTAYRIGGDALFNAQGPFTIDDRYSNFFTAGVPGGPTYTTPGAVAPLLIGNDYETLAGRYTQWRTDSALTQLGPTVTLLGSSRIQSAISVVTPVNGALQDFGVGGAAGLIEKSDYTDPAGSGYGSKVIFSSFGLEGLSDEYYEITYQNVHFYFVHNNRANIVHNVVNWMRTGSYQGRIFLGTSNQVGVPGATVYLVPFGGAAIPGPRQTYSAITSDGSDGNPIGFYHMDGLEPGAYEAFVYKTGFSEAKSPTFNPTAMPFTVAGDTTVNNVNLNINPLPPGALAGKVTNSANNQPVAGATVTFTSTDGVTTITATTNAQGNYNVAAPAGSYTGVATSTNPSGTSTTVTGITVTTGATTTVNFTINPNPGTIVGTVIDGANGQGLVGATVAFSLSSASPGTPPQTTVQTGTGGTFTSPGLGAGTYIVMVSDPGFYDPAISHTATVTSGNQTNLGTITLQPANTVTVNVTVTSTTGTPINNATIAFKDLAGNNVATTPSPLVSNGSGVYSGTIAQGNYLISVTAPTYLSNTVQATITANPASVTVQLTPESVAKTFSAGQFHMISWPYNYIPTSGSAFDAIFGPLITINNGGLSGNRSHAYSYDAAIGNYVTDPAFPADGLRAGYGYFIYLLNSVTTYNGSLAGTPVTGAVTIPLQNGWNMIGVPSTAAVGVSSLQVVINGNPYSFSQGVNLYHVLGPTLYTYDPSLTGSSPYDALTAGSSMQPYVGYWLYARGAGLSLTIPAGG